MDAFYESIITPEDLITVEKTLKTLLVTEMKNADNILGKNITDIIKLIDEVNIEIFNKSRKIFFRLEINGKDYINYLMDSKEDKKIKDITVRLIIEESYHRSTAIIFTHDFDKINKEKVFKWMLETLIKEIS